MDVIMRPLDTLQMPTVINVRGLRPNDPSVLYCGRGFGGWAHSPLHNPFKNGTREENIEQFRHYLWERIKKGELIHEIANIREDEQLGCWCAPQACHCDVILKARQYILNR